MDCEEFFSLEQIGKGITPKTIWETGELPSSNYLELRYHHFKYIKAYNEHNGLSVSNRVKEVLNAST